MNVKNIWPLITESAEEWDKDKCPRLGAAISYYTLFSLAPILIIAIAIAGLIFGQEAAQGQIVAQIQGLVGSEGAQAVQTMLENAYKSSDSVWATAIALATLMIGATGVFIELQDSLNTVWEVMPKPGRGIKGILQDRLFSFGVVLGVGFLLLVSLILSAGLTALSNYASSLLPGTAFIWQVVNFVVSFAVTTFLFAMIYKLLPDVKLEWKHVWIGGAVTAVLFTIGKFLIGLYLGNSSTASTYGAAGSLVVLLVWVYYSAQIFLFGAEFTQVYARRHCKDKVPPQDNAISLEGVARDKTSARQIAKKAIEAKEEADKEEEKKEEEKNEAEKKESQELQRDENAMARIPDEAPVAVASDRAEGEAADGEARSKAPEVTIGRDGEIRLG